MISNMFPSCITILPDFYVIVPIQPYIPMPQPEIQSKTQEVQKQEQQLQKIELLDITIQDLKRVGPHVKRKNWTEQQDRILKKEFPKRDRQWKKVTNKLAIRNKCMAQSRYKRLQFPMRKPWSTEDDEKLRRLFQDEKKDWEQIASFFKNRTLRQVKDRYYNHARKGLLKQAWSFEDEMKLVNLINGRKTSKINWKEIFDEIGQRSETQIKNQYFSRLKRIAQKKERSRKRR